MKDASRKCTESIGESQILLTALAHYAKGCKISMLCTHLLGKKNKQPNQHLIEQPLNLSYLFLSSFSPAALPHLLDHDALQEESTPVSDRCLHEHRGHWSPTKTSNYTDCFPTELKRCGFPP